MIETQQIKAKIIAGDSFSVFVRNANNNEHRTSGGSYESGEYFVVRVILEGFHDNFIVPTKLSEIKEDSGQYDKNFKDSFVEYLSDFN